MVWPIGLLLLLPFANFVPRAIVGPAAVAVTCLLLAWWLARASWGGPLAWPRATGGWLAVVVMVLVVVPQVPLPPAVLRLISPGSFAVYEHTLAGYPASGQACPAALGHGTGTGVSWAWFLFWPVAAVVAATIRRREQVRGLLVGFILAACAHVVIRLAPLVTAPGAKANVNLDQVGLHGGVSEFLVLAAPLGLAMFLATRKVEDHVQEGLDADFFWDSLRRQASSWRLWHRLVLGVAAAMAALAVFLSFSMAALGALLAAVLTMGAFWLRATHPRPQQGWRWGAAGLVAAGGLLAAQHQVWRWWRLAEGLPRAADPGVWTVAVPPWAAWLNFPLFGVGPGNYGFLRNQYPALQGTGEAWWGWFRFLSELGTLLTLALLLTFGLVVAATWRRAGRRHSATAKWLACGLTAGAGGVLLTGLLDARFLTDTAQVLALAVTAGLAVAAVQMPGPPPAYGGHYRVWQFPWRLPVRLAVGVVAIALGLAGLMMLVRPWRHPVRDLPPPAGRAAAAERQWLFCRALAEAAPTQRAALTGAYALLREADGLRPWASTAAEGVPYLLIPGVFNFLAGGPEPPPAAPLLASSQALLGRAADLLATTARRAPLSPAQHLLVAATAVAVPQRAQDPVWHVRAALYLAPNDAQVLAEAGVILYAEGLRRSAGQRPATWPAATAEPLDAALARLPGDTPPAAVFAAGAACLRTSLLLTPEQAGPISRQLATLADSAAFLPCVPDVPEVAEGLVRLYVQRREWALALAALAPGEAAARATAGRAAPPVRTRADPLAALLAAEQRPAARIARQRVALTALNGDWEAHERALAALSAQTQTTCEAALDLARELAAHQQHAAVERVVKHLLDLAPDLPEPHLLAATTGARPDSAATPVQILAQLRQAVIASTPALSQPSAAPAAAGQLLRPWPLASYRQVLSVLAGLTPRNADERATAELIRGAATLLAGDTALAVEMLQPLVGTTPANDRYLVWFYRGLAAELAGDRPGALAAYREVRQQVPAMLPAWCRLQALGDDQEAPADRLAGLRPPIVLHQAVAPGLILLGYATVPTADDPAKGAGRIRLYWLFLQHSPAHLQVVLEWVDEGCLVILGDRFSLPDPAPAEAAAPSPPRLGEVRVVERPLTGVNGAARYFRVRAGRDVVAEEPAAPLTEEELLNGRLTFRLTPP